jgi:hypothetical protein
MGDGCRWLKTCDDHPSIAYRLHSVFRHVWATFAVHRSTSRHCGGLPMKISLSRTVVSFLLLLAVSDSELLADDVPARMADKPSARKTALIKALEGADRLFIEPIPETAERTSPGSTCESVITPILHYFPQSFPRGRSVDALGDKTLELMIGFVDRSIFSMNPA